MKGISYDYLRLLLAITKTEIFNKNELNIN